MKLFRILGAEGEMAFQERVPDSVPEIYMEWPKPIYTQITKLEVVEVKLKQKPPNGHSSNNM